MTRKNGFACLFVSSLLLILPLSLNAAPLISLDADHSDIVTVLKSISQQAELNLVISKNVTGTITVKLDKVPLEEALRSVLKTGNFIYKFEDGILNVYTLSEQQQQERFSRMTTRVYTLRHADVADLRRPLLSMKSTRGRIELNEKANQVVVTETQDKVMEIETAIARLDQEEIIRKYKLVFADAEDVKAMLQQVIPAEKGSIFVDKRTNSIVLKTTPAMLTYVDELVSGWDVQSKQVLIEAKILQITLNENKKTGIDWQYLHDRYDLNINFPQDLTTGGIFQVGTLTSDDYKVVLEALETDANADVLSAPRIMVMDGKEASILVGSSEPYTVQQKDIDTGLITTETRFIDVGIKLNVFPTITEDGYVIMDIHPEVSSARRVPEVDNALAVDTTEADTTLMVKDGDTIVLGGLIKDSIETETNKIPILGDIPLIGWFFQNHSNEKVKQEIVVFITPQISSPEMKCEGLLDEARRIEQLTRRSLLLRQHLREQSSKGVSED